MVCRCALSNSNGRWTNTAPPAIRSSIHFVGSADSLTPAGNVSINLGDLSFLNIPSQSSQGDASNSSAADPNSPQKKRKFKAVATTGPVSSNPVAAIASTSASTLPSALAPFDVTSVSRESSLTPVPTTPVAQPPEESQGGCVNLSFEIINSG